MEARLAKRLVEMCVESGVDARIYEDYSGRAMFGKNTTGIVIPTLVALIEVLINAMIVVDVEDESEYEMVGNLKYDNLGKDFILY